MNAIDITTNFNKAVSLHAPADLYAKKRAKLGSGKKTAIDEIYDGFLRTVAVPVESKDLGVITYEDILSGRNLTSYFSWITNPKATGAKKLRVGEVVATAASKFSDAISIEYPKPKEVPAPKEEVAKPVVSIETPKVSEEMTRTRRHEENAYEEATTVHQEVPTPAVDEASNRRLDSYLSSNAVGSSTSIEDQKVDKLAKKLSEIAALNRKASDLQSQAKDLLVEEQAVDARINEALKKADDDYFSATQSLDEVAAQINETQERIRRKQELLNRLNNGSKVM